MPIKDLAGQKFGRLLALELSNTKKSYDRGAVWKCLCDCGNIIETQGHGLRKRQTQSCGCLRRERLTAATKKYDDTATGYYYKVYQKNAKRDGRDFKLSYEQFADLVSKPCHYCGHPGRWINLRQYRAFVNGIDRVDNSGGYTLDNVVSCCSECNNRKNNRSVDYLLNRNKLLTAEAA